MHRLYRLLTDVTAPFIALYLRLRRTKGKEDQERFRERLGFASISRPKGKLVWCHASSVGEALSVITLLKNIEEEYPDWRILITTGTVTSASLVRARKSEHMLHQYIPVDRWPYVMRFLRHWKPDLVLWIESELWPNMLTAIATEEIPAILLNGRMSDRSYKRWRMIPGGAKEIMSAFSLGLTQTGVERNRFASLGLRNVQAIGNLKYTTAPLPFTEEDMAKLKTSIGERPVWLMASTHPGEDEIAMKVHQHLLASFPDLLTIIVPRHTARSLDIKTLAQQCNLTGTLRSNDEAITKDTDIYIADTMGELGLFYRLVPICCLAGSFTWGGHNPVEPAQLGCAVVYGPKMDNFLLMSDDMLSEGAAWQVMDTKELTESISYLLHNPEEVQRRGQTAQKWAEAKQGILDETLKILAPYFKNTPKS